MRGDAFFAEEGFADWMHQEVEPYLKAHCEEGYLWSGDGISIHYSRYRLENAKKCVVISHGFCEFAEKYNEFIYYLLQAGISVYVPEHRGHGYSEREAADAEMVHVTDYQEYVRDFVCFVENVVPEDTERILFGHSMGGAVAALVLEQYPHLFSAAILSAPMCGMRTGKYPAWLAKGISWLCSKLGSGTRYAPGQGRFREEPDFAGSSCLSQARYDYIFEKRLENPLYRTYGGSYSWVCAGIRAAKKLMKRRNLEKIETPILLFEAGWDHMVDNGAIERFAEETRHTELVVMQDAKHEIFHAGLTARRNFYERVLGFLERREEAYEGEMYLVKEGV